MFSPRFIQRVQNDIATGAFGHLKTFKSLCKMQHNFLENSIFTILHTPHLNILEFVLDQGVKPSANDISKAMELDNVDAFHMLVGALKREDDKEETDKEETLTLSLRCIAFTGIEDLHYAEYLIEHGANPMNRPLLINAVENGHLPLVKLLKRCGAFFDEEHFAYACASNEYEIAYWLYENGVQGNITDEFRAFMKEKERQKEEAARKIYFWILPKLYRNEDFVRRQAEKSYNTLFGVEA